MPLQQSEIDNAVNTCALSGVEASTCGRAVLAKLCGISERKARVIQSTLRAGSAQQDNRQAAPAAGLGEQHDHRGDRWDITMPHTSISTLEELVEHCKVDLTVWEVERWVCNKWECAAKVGPKENKRMAATPLFQVKAWLVKKGSLVLASKGADSKAEFLKQFRDIVSSGDTFKFEPRRMVVNKHGSFDPQHVEVAVVGCSDHHLTETVRPEDCNGINVYNSIVCANRMWEHAQKVKTVLARHMGMYTISKIWSPLLGDVLNGTIHDEYVATNDLSDPAAVILAERLLYMFYKELGTLGLPIEISAVHGNHPRLTPKMPTKNQAHTNLDWQVYEILADRLAGDSQFQLDICTSQIGQKKLFGWNYIYEHGIGIKKSGVDKFADTLRAMFDDPTYREATGHQGAAFDHFVMGNLHTPSFLERGVINGSYIGQNELGQGWHLKPIRAQQLMWGVSKKHVRTWNYALDMTHIRSEQADNPFSEYAAAFLKRHHQ